MAGAERTEVTSGGVGEWRGERRAELYILYRRERESPRDERKGR